jgi:DNA-binding transcriptional regulator GbsR (MarR family)
MTLEEAKNKFIQTWGGLGSNWGINKTMAQIHALLMVNSEPLTTEDVMEKLEISRGNANINLRALCDWGLAERMGVKGERKEFFIAEKDIWRVATRIAHERRKREVEPILKALSAAKEIDAKDIRKKEAQDFIEFIESLEQFTKKVDGAFDKLIKADQHWFTGTLLKLLK